jgi:hypothetical protein
VAPSWQPQPAEAGERQPYNTQDNQVRRDATQLPSETTRGCAAPSICQPVTVSLASQLSKPMNKSHDNKNNSLSSSDEERGGCFPNIYASPVHLRHRWAARDLARPIGRCVQILL